jgi:hypothetical protein
MIDTIKYYIWLHWPIIAGWSWAVSGGIHWVNNHGRVRLRPQKLIYNLICGPIVWFCQSVGFILDFLDWVFRGFKTWLYKRDEKE